MIDALYIGATGMQAQQANVDVISNNLANLNTAAYKKVRVGFEDLMVRETLRRKGVSEAGNSVRIGTGAAVAGTSVVFTPGELKKTDSPSDVAIRGDGFFEVTLPDGSSAYTRAGTLQAGRDGVLATADGYPLKPAIQVPADTSALIIEPGGRVLAQVPDESGPLEIGQIELARFTNSDGLTPVGGNLYVAGERSGEALIAKPGEEGTGQLAQGFQEASNVKLIEEMVSLIAAQRAYEINAKIVQAADDMLAMNNNLRR